MRIFVEGEYVECILYLAQKNVEDGRRTALVTDDAKMLPFDFKALERKKIDFKGIDIFLGHADFDERDYNVIIYYNCKKTQTYASNDICLWIIQQGTVVGADPFEHCCCRKKLVVRNYTEHSMFDSMLSKYDDYVVYCIPYTQEDQMENTNLQMIGTWNYSNLSDKYKEFLADICSQEKGHKRVLLGNSKNKNTVGLL